MIFATLSFLLGDFYLQTLTHLPKMISIFYMMVASLMICLAIKKNKFLLTFFLAFILGFGYTYWYAQHILSWTLSKTDEGKPLLIVGYIDSLPMIEKTRTHFIFAVDELTTTSGKQRIHTKMNVYLYDKSAHKNASHPNIIIPKINIGERWQFKARLKRVHGLSNLGETLDYEAFALEKGLRANATIIESEDNKLLSQSSFKYRIGYIRQIYQDKIKTYLPKSPTSAWLLALLIGERGDIPANYWQVLRNTGTNHLMVVAGLHIGFVAGFVFLMISRLWKQVPHLILWIPLSIAASTCALMAAILYSICAGFSLPTQRACLMLFAFMLALFFRKQINPWQSWCMAMLCVLIINPLAILSESFWLSFSTLALIIYCMRGRIAPCGLWWKWFRVQWVIGFGLIPLSLLFFHECSLISFIANTIAIPWLGFLILPFCFLGGLCLWVMPKLGVILLWIADKSLSYLWAILTWLSQLNFASWHIIIPTHWILLTTVIGFILLLLPAGFPGRIFGFIWILPLCFYTPLKPNHGEAWLTLLDVGQGLSVVIETQDHTLVYDAGSHLFDSDMGERVVIPFLEMRKTQKINTLVISHGDNDHIGGAEAIIKRFPIDHIATSVPERFTKPHVDYCLQGMHWHWDGIDFSFLSPSEENIDDSNDSSCVLRVDVGQQTILLTGDIEKFAERQLLKTSPQLLSATVLIAPHHGSKTSGLIDFIKAVNPRYVLYATGYRNQYHFPHPSVTQSYNTIGAAQFNTAYVGAVSMKLTPQGISSIELYREAHKHYWHHD